MYFKKLYIFVLVSMTLLVALGCWVIADGAAAWKARPRIDSVPYQQETLSCQPLFYESGVLG